MTERCFKKMKRYAVLLTILSILLTSCGRVTDTKPAPDKISAAELTETMTTEEKVAQLLMVHCNNANMEHILSTEPGGIIMFGVDFDGLSRDEVTDKIAGYKSAARIEPIISVDEEGGTVVRVSSNPSLAPAKYESPQYYYNIGGLSAITENAAEKSDLLASLGITMNLAPVADVSENPSDFIYDRSLGMDAAATAEYISAVVGTMKQHNVLSCLKHFPGYGGNLDTHTGVAIDDRPLSQLRENDFLPFKAGIDAGADAVLVAHNIITDVDGSQPASISPAIHEILRTELGFNGIIITDDMNMGAMSAYQTPYKKAVLAGNDMMIVSDPDTAFNEILTAVNDGSIPMEMLDSAVLRVLRAKGY